MTVIAVVFAFLVLLRWGVLAFGVAALVPCVRGCPACFRPTLPIRRPWLRRLLPWLRWRWCPECRWEGLSRRTPGALTPPTPVREASPESPASAVNPEQ